MRRAITLAIVLVSFLAVSTTTVLAAVAGRSCTKKVGLLVINPECGVNGSNTSVNHFPWYECEDCTHRSTCDDDQLFIQEETIRYAGKGADPCSNIVYRECVQVNACNGHPLPPFPSDWVINPPP